MDTAFSQWAVDLRLQSVMKSLAEADWKLEHPFVVLNLDSARNASRLLRAFKKAS
jgi:hypothetical protein